MAPPPNSFTTVDLNEFQACIALIGNVKNGEELRKNLINGNLSASLINCTNVIDVEQLKLATFKALTSQAAGKMVTKTVYTEILYHLCPTRQISYALKVFGMQPTDETVLAVTVGDSREADVNKVLEMTCSAGAEPLPLDQVSAFSSAVAAKKTYKIEDEELAVGTLSEAVVSRIAAKEYLT